MSDFPFLFIEKKNTLKKNIHLPSTSVLCFWLVWSEELHISSALYWFDYLYNARFFQVLRKWLVFPKVLLLYFAAKFTISICDSDSFFQFRLLSTTKMSEKNKESLENLGIPHH